MSALIRYAKGLRRHFLENATRLQNRIRFLKGYLTGYPVYRPPFDHTVYEEDNRRLGSTFRSSAKMTHSPSCARLPDGPALIEFEHPFALMGHIDEGTDFEAFRKQLPSRLTAFCSNHDPRIHRLLGSSLRAITELRRMLEAAGCSLPDDCIHFAYWAIPQQRAIMPHPTSRLSVFHYGRSHPGYKGTRDVLDLARHFPSVRFLISINTDLPIVKHFSRSCNVCFLPGHSKVAYNWALRSSHVLLNPVYGDGWGVVLEAESLALPVISYDTYDKPETVVDGETGFLVECPRHLSLYDGFFDPGFRNFQDFEERVLSTDNRVQVDRLAIALERYVADHALLMEHSANTGRFFPDRFSPDVRLKKIRLLYGEILAAM